MYIEIASTREQVEALRPAAAEWRDTCNAAEFGITLDMDTHIRGLHGLLESENADLLVMMADGKPVGYMGLVYFDSPLGNQRVASERFWYVKKESRRASSVKFVIDAVRLAKEHGCSHLIMNASALASDSHDKLCKYYERIDMRLFETSFCMNLEV